MVSQWNEVAEQVYTTTVKNTFIDFETVPTFAQPRRASLPASSRLCRETDIKARTDSDASTDAQTEASTCSECGVKTPMSLDSYCFESADSQECPDDACAQSLWSTPPSRMTSMPQSPMRQAMPSPKHVGSCHLSAKADAFKPQLAPEEPAQQQGRYRFAEVINYVKKKLQESELVAHVEASDDMNGWFLTIQPKGLGESWQSDSLIAAAKEALLEAASQSKRSYVMGYCGPKPFIEQPQGFEATLGIMESARSACYHVFKKGFCRHGTECSKQHPANLVPVHVLVESAQLKSCTRFAAAFEQEVANLAMSVASTLGACTLTDKVEAFKDEGCQGWTIEITPQEELKPHKEYLIDVAKNALFNASSGSNTAYIMGYATKPFIAKAQGFLTMIGDMQDDTRACWDFYSKGICTRDCACRWEHPECLMPVNVVIKERSSLRCSAASFQYLVGNGLLTTARQ